MLHSDQNFPDTPELPGNRTGIHPANSKENQLQRLEIALQEPCPAFQLARTWAGTMRRLFYSQRAANY